MATNKNEKMDAIIVTLGGIYPFFRRKSKSIKPCLFFKPLDSRGLKEGLYKPSQIPKYSIVLRLRIQFAILHTLLHQHKGYESQEKGISGLLLKTVGMGFGNHLIARYIEHGATGKAQHHGEEGGRG